MYEQFGLFIDGAWRRGAATEAVSRWKFQPATQDGNPVPSQDKRRIVFKLN